jgi:RNA polymerase sigma-54 factor
LKLGLHQSARLEQRLIQSPQMIQAMQILQLPSLDLEARIEQELVENPFLEVSEPEAQAENGQDTGATTDSGPEAGPTETSEGETERDGVEGMLDLLERYERDFGDGRSTRVASSEEGDRKYEAMQNAPSAPPGLVESLLDELAFLQVDGESRAIIEYVVWSLDQRGYLTTSIEDLTSELSVEFGREVEPEEIELAIARLRRATHPALASRDLRECLLLELEARGTPDPLVKAIVANHLPDLEANRLPRIAKATGHTVEEVKRALEEVRTLDPIPGAAYGGTPAATITPDVIVEEIDGEYVVRLERERAPQLVISSAYKKLLQQSQRGDGVKEWVKKRLESARWFIDALQQRQSTLHRIAEVVFRHQRGFLDKGPAGQAPLRMQEVADEIGVHISTVSRGVSGKYAQTPRGIFPLKFFFTGGTTKATGEVASQVSVQQRLRELVDDEDKLHPLSDDQLAAKLAASDGIRIARRTVTKYRKALSIPSSTQRREY